MTDDAISQLADLSRKPKEWVAELTEIAEREFRWLSPALNREGARRRLIDAMRRHLRGRQARGFPVKKTVDKIATKVLRYYRQRRSDRLPSWRNQAGADLAKKFARKR